MFHLNEHQQDLAHRAVNRWLSELDEFEIYSASDDALGSEAVYILTSALRDLSDIFDPEDN